MLTSYLCRTRIKQWLITKEIIQFFEEGREYEIVDSVGSLQPKGYVVMNNIPVADEGRPVFEDRFKNRAGNVENMEGFQAIRILRPVKGNTYVVLTQWRNAQDFEDWKNSQSFEQAHKNSGPKHEKNLHLLMEGLHYQVSNASVRGINEK